MRNQNPCFGCEQTMYVAPSQSAYYHGACRKRARHEYGGMSAYVRALQARKSPPVASSVALKSVKAPERVIIHSSSDSLLQKLLKMLYNLIKKVFNI